VAQLVDQHRVAQVQVRRGGVEAGLDAQRAVLCELGPQIGLGEHLVGAAQDQRQGGGLFRGRLGGSGVGSGALSAAFTSGEDGMAVSATGVLAHGLGP
jgi:hypothetical protein